MVAYRFSTPGSVAVDTSVVRMHRGNRLGLLLKAEMLGWLRESNQLHRLDTWNAASNTHMIGINEKLGYECSRERSGGSVTCDGMCTVT